MNSYPTQPFLPSEVTLAYVHEIGQMAATNTRPFSLAEGEALWRVLPGLQEALAWPLEFLGIGCPPLERRQFLREGCREREQNKLSLPQPRGALSGNDCVSFLSWSARVSVAGSQDSPIPLAKKLTQQPGLCQGSTSVCGGLPGGGKFREKPFVQRR